jgi:hypothetical protein
VPTEQVWLPRQATTVQASIVRSQHELESSNDQLGRSIATLNDCLQTVNFLLFAVLLIAFLFDCILQLFVDSTFLGFFLFFEFVNELIIELAQGFVLCLANESVKIISRMTKKNVILDQFWLAGTADWPESIWLSPLQAIQQILYQNRSHTTLNITLASSLRCKRLSNLALPLARVSSRFALVDSTYSSISA